MGFLDRFRGHADTRPQPVPQPPLGPAPGQLRYAVIDIETTGLSPYERRILEVAIVTTDPWGPVLDEWSSKVNLEGPVGATHIHGITDADVADSPVRTASTE